MIIIHQSAATYPRAGSRVLRRRWIRAFVVGELVGFVPPAVTGAGLSALGVSDAWLVAGLVLAGAVEGGVLGLMTGRVLSQVVPAINLVDWVRATAQAAAIAWLAGMGGSALIQEVGPWSLVVVGPGMVVGLVSMGWLQWRVMRVALPRSGVWVPVTSLAWLVGVIIPVAALSLAPNTWPLALHAAIAVAAGVAMGAVVGVLTGTTLVRLVNRRAGACQPAVGR